MMLNTILTVGASLSVFLIVVGFYEAFLNPRTAVLKRLDKSAAVGQGGEQPEKVPLEGVMWALGRIGRIIPGRARLEVIQGNLIKAQVFMRAEEFVGLTLVVGVLIYLVLYLLGGAIALAVAGGLVGLYLPGIVVNQKKKKRMQAMTDQLPEALNTISSGMRAGFSFPQAVSIVVREMAPPLSTEFSKVLRDNRIGKPMDDALNDLLDRVENDDLELLITALLIQRQVGGNLAEVLDGISHTIRERVRIKGEINTLTAEGKLSALILSLLPIVLAGGMALLNPGYIRTLVEEPIGIAMIVAALILQVIGVLIMRKIINIDI